FSFGQFESYLYGIYYYGLLLLGVCLATLFIRSAKSNKIRQSLYAMIVGYFIFLVPTGVANLIDQKTMAAIPSIMCGFAVLFAVILYGYVLPRTTDLRKNSS